MEKGNNSNSLGVCEKIFSVIRVSPAIQTIRRITNRSREPTPNMPKVIEIQSEPADQHPQMVLEGSSHRLHAPTKTQETDHGVVPINFLSTPNGKAISSSSSTSSSVPIMKKGNVTNVGHEEHGRGLASNVSFHEKLKPKAPAANLVQPAKKVVVGQSSHGQAAAKVGSKVEPEPHDNHDYKRKIKEDQLSPHKKGVIVVSEQISPPADQAKSASKGNEGQENGGNKLGKRPAAEVADRLNDTFSNYINHAKIRIKTVSDVKDKSSSILGLDGVHDTGKRESLKDHFSDYIHRAKNKIRSTSFGTGKNTSFKRE